MKFVKKCFILSLVIALTCAITSVNAFPRASKQIDRSEIGAIRSGGGKNTISFYIEGTGKMQYLGAESIVIYQESGGNWVEMESYDRYDKGMVGYNTIVLSKELIFSGEVGKKYKIQAEFFAENSSGYDSRTKTVFVTA